jgi:hypothetical protein
MNPAPPPLPVARAPRRSVLVTLLGWAVIVACCLALPIGFITCIMILAGSPGTSTFDPLGFLIIVVAPPVSLIAGIGILRRWRWARLYLLALAGTVFGFQCTQFVRPPTPRREYFSPSGVRITELGTERHGSIALAVVSLGMLACLMSPRARAEFARRSPGRGPHNTP